MKRYILIAVVMFMVCACGGVNRAAAHLFGSSKVCVEGVTYLQFPSGACPQVSIDGKPVACK